METLINLNYKYYAVINESLIRFFKLPHISVSLKAFKKVRKRAFY